jgi:uncharacterized protein (DUF486 family)
VILVGWLIAGARYAIASPAKRIGSAVYSAAELNTIHDAVMLIVFFGFSVLYRGGALRFSNVA